MLGKQRMPKPAEQPASRRYDFEKVLCGAIKGRVLVALFYKDDVTQRLFQPTAVYTSTRHKVTVSGVQINNPVKPSDNLEPHNFEVGRITRLVVTGEAFIVPSDFNRFDSKYANGIICSV